MKPQDLLFWIVMALLVAFVLLLFSNKIIMNMLSVTVSTTP